jgi:arginase
VSTFLWRRSKLPDDYREPGVALYLDEVVRACEQLAGAVSSAIEQSELALVLGGDHALSIGSIAGAASRCQRLAVIWIDAHADLNWPEVSPSGRLHGMSLAASLGRGPASVVDLHHPGPKLREQDACLIGIRLLDPGEEAWLQNDEATLFTMPEIDAYGPDAIMERVISRIRVSGADAVHISFDVDSLDPLVMPGTGTPVHGGFTYREAARILRLLHRSALPVRSIDWVELNPVLDRSNASAEVAAGLLAVALGDDVMLRCVLQPESG